MTDESAPAPRAPALTRSDAGRLRLKRMQDLLEIAGVERQVKAMKLFNPPQGKARQLAAMQFNLELTLVRADLAEAEVRLRRAKIDLATLNRSAPSSED